MILYNAIRCPDGEVLVSRHRHDYVSHKCRKTGKIYMVDGGRDYMRRSTHEDQEELSIVWEPGMPHDILREYLSWGTFGTLWKSGKEKVRHVLLKDLDTDYINAILDTRGDIDQFYAKAFLNELLFRGEEMK